MADNNPRRANGHRRDQVRARVLAEENTCGICGQPVDKTLTMMWGKHSDRCTKPGCPGCVPHPDRAEVDEIIPVSKGGSPFERSNCRLSHRRCNQGRNRKPVVLIERGEYKTSRAWGPGASD